MTCGNAGRLPSQDFWNGRKVLLTGSTGFKGVWMAAMLERLGARVQGIGLRPDSRPSIFDLVSGALACRSDFVDIRDGDALRHAVLDAEPEIVIHMAAQALVLDGLAAPRATFETNVNGTINLLEALRQTDRTSAVLVVTSDKVYANDKRGTAFAETAPLGGDDPYSASKSCAELVVNAYAKSYLEPLGIPTATARAGNVIGGGDWSRWRLVPG